jgi:predicted HTH transcriptional regulator
MRREESEILEFKLRIDSQRKIAKTLVALANGQGGQIVIGVRDSGSVAGCRVDEEFYMIQGAAQVHTRPEVPISAREERWDHKPVLVVDVPSSLLAPHLAHDEEQDVWRVYVRRGAANYLANRVLVESIHLRFREGVKATSEQLRLLHLMKTDELVSASMLARLSGLPIRDVEDGLAVLVRWQKIESVPVDQGWRYRPINE